MKETFPVPVPTWYRSWGRTDGMPHLHPRCPSLLRAGGGRSCRIEPLGDPYSDSVCGWCRRLYRRYDLNQLIAVSPSGCWEWQGAREADGYGVLTRNNKQLRAHRYAYELTKGPIPNGLVVCHACDNPPCVNPNHLFLGTTGDNTRDAMVKGRLASGLRNGAYTKPDRRRRGESHGSTKLSEVQVAEIRAAYAAGGVTMKMLGLRYGIDKSHVHRIIRGVSWGVAA